MRSYKHLFRHALEADPQRLHFAAHSHHPWPDATRAAHLQAWDDAARLLDDKWDHVMGEVWPAAQSAVARELNLPDANTIAFAPNTHELVNRIFSAFGARPVRILSTDGEFHTFRRQSARWVESGAATLEIVPLEPFDSFDERFLARARSGEHDLIFLSHVFFNSGRIFGGADQLVALARPEGPWIVIDGYHGFMGVETDLSSLADRVFYLAGGYKYAMAGEGAAFLHAPPGFGARPENTGWYAEFSALAAKPGQIGYAQDGARFMGATFDPSGLYRLVASTSLLRAEGLSTRDVAARTRVLLAQLADAVASGRAGALKHATLLNPLSNDHNARFLALRHPDAQAWKAKLASVNIVTDVRGDVLRLGLGLYHDAADIETFCERASAALG